VKFLINIYQDEDGVFIAECPSIPGCASQGETASEAETNLADAIRECLAVERPSTDESVLAAPSGRGSKSLSALATAMEPRPKGAATGSFSRGL
jgi:predicted RNase H-like HicB family nuclease